MSQKTDPPEFAPGFLWQICLITGLVLGLVVFGRGFFTWHMTEGPRAGAEVSQTTLFPWVIAGGQTVKNGLMAFNGKPAMFPPVGDQARVLAAVLISVVLCPTVFFFEWRHRRMTASARKVRPPLRISSVFNALCGFVTLFLALAIGPIAWTGERFRADMRRAQAVQDNRDVMINELNMLAVDLTQYYILPKQLGGGGRSFEGCSVPQKYSKTEDATYTVTGKRNQADLRAVSARYPSAAIDVKVDSLGRMVWWTYEGEFK